MQADPHHRDFTKPNPKGDSTLKISKKQFFDFCTNRQHVVRRLLEALATSEIAKDNTNVLSEIVHNDDHIGTTTATTTTTTTTTTTNTTTTTIRRAYWW